MRLPSDQNPVFWLRCALFVVATFCFVRSIRYGLGGEQLPVAIEAVSLYVPIWGWGIAWGIAGLFALACVPKAWPSGSGFAIALSVGFAVGYTYSWVSAWGSPDSPSHADYVGASNYWTVALLLVCGYFGFTRALKKPPPPFETP